MKFLDAAGLAAIARALAETHEVYAPRRVKDRLVLARLLPLRSEADAKGALEVGWNPFRLAEPLKGFWFPTARVLARWTREGPREGPSPVPRAIFGAKACDLKALAVVDKVLREHAYREPTYAAAREQNFVVAGDCSAHGDSCFCTMLGDRPWPEAGFDLSLSPAEGGYLVEAGSERGERLLSEHASRLRDARPEEVEARARLRAGVESAVRAQNRPYATRDPLQVSVEKNLKTRIWGKLAATCVECGACNAVCPTCHCFLLHEVPTADGAIRERVWDQCFHAGYARMAGGGTPRLQLTERFKNHYYHKFVAFPRNWGVTACSGCGRCVDACMGRIDKRECLHRLETEWIPSEVMREVV